MPLDLEFFNLFPEEDESDQEITLSDSVIQAVGEWKKDLKTSFTYINELDPLFAVAWETASRERIRSEIRDEDSQANLAIVHVKATLESYTRHFLLPMDEGYTSKSPSTPQNFSSTTSAPRPSLTIVQLTLPEEKRHTISGVHPPQTDLLQIEPKSANGISDAYTSKPLSIDQMSVAKIRKDLDYMWKRRIYSDIQLAVRSNANPCTDDHDHDAEEKLAQENMVTIFSCHRSILMARSPYFREALGVIVKNATSLKGGLSVLALPHKPFTPTTTEMILRFLYTGELELPKSGFSMMDLPQPLTIHKGAQILRIPSLVDLISAHVVEMLHGLFHVRLSPSDYFRRIDGIWKNMVSIGGCVCCQCALSVPRLLKFLAEPDVNNPLLERGARRALVGLFGAGWCTHEFASLPEDILDSLLLDLKKMMIPRNALALLFAVESGLARLDGLQPLWAESLARLFLSARALIDRLICATPRACFNSDEWKKVITGHLQAKKNNINTHRFGSHEMRLNWILGSISRGVTTPKEANALHEVLTWFTDALIFPAVPTKEFAEMILPITEQLIEKGAKRMSTHSTSRPHSLSSFGPSVIEDVGPLSNLQSSISETSLEYSNPSSRTVTTDYGLYYRRLALSEETMSDATSVARKRYSWGTLFSEI